MRSLGICLLSVQLLLVPARAQSPEQKRATIEYLRGLQMERSGFLPNRPAPGQEKPTQASLRATTAALRALKYFGGEARDLPACREFVARCFDAATGGFADVPGGKPDVMTTAVGLMALVELKMPLEKYITPAVRYLGEHTKGFEDIRIAAAGLEAVSKRPPQAEAWLKQLAAMRNPDGTYGKGAGMARDTGGAVVAVLRLGGQLEHKDNVLEALAKGQRSDGGFGKADAKGSDLETSYRVLRAFHMLKAKPPQVDALKEFIGKCRNADGGYGVAPGTASSVGGTYFASIILHWLAEK
jgi:prenyltransferase beta subunit